MAKRSARQKARELQYHEPATVHPLFPPDRGWSPHDHNRDVDARDRKYVKNIRAMSAQQQALIDAIEERAVVLALGPAGTGKTYLAIAKAVDALEKGKGVCQDFVHLTLILLRAMGIPARYVSGYLHPKRDAVIGKTVDGRSHAWIQAWTGGWWNYDPTNDTDITEQYISVGIGRDYSDVSPLRGIYSGKGATDLDVIVEITRLG